MCACVMGEADNHVSDAKPFPPRSFFGSQHLPPPLLGVPEIMLGQPAKPGWGTPPPQRGVLQKTPGSVGELGVWGLSPRTPRSPAPGYASSGKPPAQRAGDLGEIVNSGMSVDHTLGDRLGGSTGPPPLSRGYPGGGKGHFGFFFFNMKCRNFF